MSDTEEPNALGKLLVNQPTIESICFNGQKAANTFTKLVEPALSGGLLEKTKLLTLPSTSPANATKSRTEKVKVWTQAIEPYLISLAQDIPRAP